jgi:hypothetical protein
VLVVPNKAASPPRVNEKLRVQITRVSQQDGKIRGIANLQGLPGSEDPAKYSVLVFIRSDVYYPHPFLESYAKIKANGTWEVDHIVRGSEKKVAAVLVRTDLLTPRLRISFLANQGYAAQKMQLESIQAAPDGLDEIEYQAEYSVPSTHGVPPG